MKMKDLFKGVVVASTVGMLFAGCGGEESTGSQKQASKDVKCQGINDCKGMSDCKGATNDCKGLNDCKGQGYLLVESKGVCADKGGKVI